MKTTEVSVQTCITDLKVLSLSLKNILTRGLLADPIPNSWNYHHKNCMADSKENYQHGLWKEMVRRKTSPV